MPLTNILGAVLPYVTYPNPVPVIVAAPTDPPVVCIQVNVDWVPYILGCLKALLAASTWNSDDENVVATMQENAQLLIDTIAAYEACPMIDFRLNPDDPHYWDWTSDGGVIWTRQPDTVSHFTPTYTADGTSPSGYDESVNGGLSSTDIPLLTATDPDAVVKNPTSGDENVVEATATAAAFTAQGYQIGAQLLDGQGSSLNLQKVTDIGDVAIAIVNAVETGDYATAIFAVISAL